MKRHMKRHMKRLIPILLTTALIFAMTAAAAAAGLTVGITQSAEAAVAGDEITLTVALSDAGTARAGGVAVTVSDGLEVVSGAMLISGESGTFIQKYDLSKNKGVVGFTSATDINGDFAQIVVKVKEGALGEQTVKADVILKPGDSTASATATINVVDHFHVAGEAVRENEVPASCSAEGSYDEVVYCTVCHEELSRTPKTIGKLSHTAGDPVRENEVPATYSSEGSYDEVVYCTVCHEELSREEKTIPMLRGDLTGDEALTEDDAVYLLFHVFFPEDYPVTQNCDFNGDELVDEEDAIYLYQHIFFADDYPL